VRYCETFGEVKHKNLDLSTELITKGKLARSDEGLRLEMSAFNFSIQWPLILNIQAGLLEITG